MDIGGITDLAQASNTSNRVQPRDTLSREDFFQIMTLQLSQQDPLEPADSQDFLNQLVSMDQLETNKVLTDSLTSFADNQSFTTAAALIGTQVLAQKGATQVQGFVDRVVQNPDGEVDVMVSLDIENMSANQAVGKEALALSDDGRLVSGTVESTFLDGGIPMLVLSDGIEGSDDVVVAAPNLLKLTTGVKFEDIKEIGIPENIGDLLSEGAEG